MTILLEPSRDDRAAVDKAFSLLESFGAEANTGVGVSELARRAGLSKSTAHRVLAILERNGMVERLGRAYRLGDRLQRLGHNAQAPSHDDLRDQLIPYLTDLYIATRETVHLAVLSGTDVVYLAKLYGHRRLHFPSRIGGRVPAHCTAIGKALLAYTPNSLAAVLENPLPSLTARTIADPIHLAAELDSVRRSGVARENGEASAGLSCVAMPVLGRNGRAVAALSVSGTTGDMAAFRHADILRRIAAAASRDIRTAGRDVVHRPTATQVSGTVSNSTSMPVTHSASVTNRRSSA